MPPIIIWALVALAVFFILAAMGSWGLAFLALFGIPATGVILYIGLAIMALLAAARR